MDNLFVYLIIFILFFVFYDILRWLISFSISYFNYLYLNLHTSDMVEACEKLLARVQLLSPRYL